ncbi:cell division protein FtsB [Legionella israelensis]|uniref:Cell division protein FtsB n=1 Tax=Legionella israelensis TaxID=454 RepID=A0A0W0WNI8_9GAMM|nr:cell division protein FtsB [Legionella israelensis]KTD33864.1 septum formation initiator [Legionella israelensis]QBR83590.1 cell division protein FtsB [Legionella israelensis]QBS08969.1 cell division protein FtsB [Legionella israelensis]QDP73229.1 cell division protein FtsB [Legionella israelensis]SCX81434.1 cell division protein FtsB [Legionella israelensis DSM 19235]
MRPLLAVLILALVMLQYKLWLGDGNVLQWFSLEKKLSDHERENEKLAARNRTMEAEIYELKHGEQALEEKARYELGMIKNNENYYQFVD